jgi:uncharacterized protein
VTVLLDATVLIALAVEDHVHHGAAERWFAGHDDMFATCPSTQGSLLRVLVRGGRDGSSAVAAMNRLLDHDRHEFWADDLPYRMVRMTAVVGHRQVTDAYLAALARARGGRVATFDSGLAVVHADVADQVPTAV